MTTTCLLQATLTLDNVEQKGQESFVCFSNADLQVKSQFETDSFIELKELGPKTTVYLSVFEVPADVNYTSSWWKDMLKDFAFHKAVMQCATLCPVEIQLPRDQREQAVWLSAGGFLTRLKNTHSTLEALFADKNKFLLVFHW